MAFCSSSHFDRQPWPVIRPSKHGSYACLARLQSMDSGPIGSNRPSAPSHAILASPRLLRARIWQPNLRGQGDFRWPSVTDGQTSGSPYLNIYITVTRTLKLHNYKTKIRRLEATYFVPRCAMGSSQPTPAQLASYSWLLEAEGIPKTNQRSPVG